MDGAVIGPDIGSQQYMIEDDVARTRQEEAIEVCDCPPPNIVEHDDYALAEIKAAKVRFSIRRTILYRHNCTPLQDARLFDAVDDSVMIASPGVKWSLRNHVWTVVVVACLGYTVTLRSKSAKICDKRDTRVTQVILRSYRLDGQPLCFDHFFKVSASKLFREGRPLRVVDV